MVEELAEDTKYQITVPKGSAYSNVASGEIHCLFSPFVKKKGNIIMFSLQVNCSVKKKIGQNSLFKMSLTRGNANGVLSFPILLVNIYNFNQ